MTTTPHKTKSPPTPPKEVFLKCSRQTAAAPASPRVTRISLQFGVARTSTRTGPSRPVRLRLGPGRIIALLGASGTGKTTALRALAQQYPDALRVDRTTFPAARPIIENILPQGELPDAVALLSACGFGEPRLWLRTFRELSAGERFRARLARVVARQHEQPEGGLILCDEFCTGLHRRVAHAIAFNLRKLVNRRRLCLVVAVPDADLLGDLQPDSVIHLLESGTHTEREQKPRRAHFSLLRRLHIEVGRRADYQAFAAMHYRGTDELGFVDKVFVMREGPKGTPVGIVVYSHGPLELALRNQATANRYVRNPTLLNREVRILRRLIIHPDLRGCGLGRRLVARTLPRVGTPHVECLAAMGEVNPVFEKAGMQRIGTCEPPRDQARVLTALARMDVDPFDYDFEAHVCRRPKVRRLVASAVYNWYRRTTGRGHRRVARQSPQLLARLFRNLVGSQPVYYLWSGKGRFPQSFNP